MKKKEHSHTDAHGQGQDPNQSPSADETPGSDAETRGQAAPSTKTGVNSGGPAPADEMTALRAERDDLLARLQRVSADYLNYQKRIQREIAYTHDFANESLIRSLLVVMDDMDRALEAGRKSHPQQDPLLKGMELVSNKAMEILRTYGVSPVDTEGQQFDPDHHSAVLQQPSKDCKPNTILKQLQRGYQLKGRTIRPATVIVAKAPDQEDERRSEARPDGKEEPKKEQP